ncbi:hypothetical protein N657DRAFT_661557 [Parathielavia appendiculata]|uniref:FAD-binding FR-type domain-containing protein n=1 Tax=Parathielavia appendiculata TaxID=2587402 RepID=A0AAN6Z6Z1_9PEZI|nr:hypothetical protein N657DRAFT_661557 [Parathielavia appendiculata]
MSKQSHIERTAHEPRDPLLHTVIISDITQITPTIRLFRLEIPLGEIITFLPGQWVDLYPPPQANVPGPGGFTITSCPTLAYIPSACPTSWDPSSGPTQPYRYIELAIQFSPQNPPAAYLFLPSPQLLHTHVRVRIGGSFVFPPLSSYLASNVAPGALRKLVFVAGGMGINPLMSMLSFIGEQQQQQPGEMWRGIEVRVLYSVKDPRGCGVDHVRDSKGILFLDRIVDLIKSGRIRGRLELFLTGGTSDGPSDADGAERHMVRCSGAVVPFSRRRIMVRDVKRAVGVDKEAALVYICGVPAMTDEFVEALTSPGGIGMEKSRVLFEKWW